MKESNEILEVAVEASLAASNIIMEAAHDPQISNFKKSRSDLVTTTDIESEKIIKLFTELPLLKRERNWRKRE